MKYDSIQEVTDRILNTVIFYNKKPVYITAVKEISGSKFPLVYYNELPLSNRGNKGASALSSDPKFDINGLYLGYVNGIQNNNGVVCEYYSRTSARRFKQGLCNESVIPKNTYCSWDLLLTNEFLCDTLTNNYPSLDEVVEILTDPDTDVISAAFHRRFCLEMSLSDIGLCSLHYRGSIIALGTDEDNLKKFTLPFKHKHHKEELEELGLTIKVRANKNAA
jgi:hypothetical protein